MIMSRMEPPGWPIPQSKRRTPRAALSNIAYS
jgi:hypothetical protein